MNVFTIPPDQNFLEVLAKHILDEASNGTHQLTDYKILLPNRRSCQNLRDTFLDLSDGEVMLLPQIRPLGEVEEEELYFSEIPEIGKQLAGLPPVISPLRRQFMLIKLIKRFEEQTELKTRTFDQTLQLAKSLSLLLDQVIIEEVSFENLKDIVPEEFSSYWQLTIDFLDILKTAWPAILEEHGLIEAADRRNRLLNIQAGYWDKNPPQTPVIAAGSTGTMPATARLMKTIASLPCGKVILPGFDLNLDDESWDNLDASHPQSLFKDLFAKWNFDKEQVKPLHGSDKLKSPRAFLTTEIMRPAETVSAWRNIEETAARSITEDLKHIELYECDTSRQEAMVIALKLRSILEEKEQTAALVTPNRALAEQVKYLCERWGIHIDDTAGMRLLDTTLGVFIAQSFELFLNQFKPSNLLGLLKHPLFCAGLERGEVLKEISAIDLSLRGPQPRHTLEKVSEFNVIQQIEHIAQPLKDVLFDLQEKPLSDYISAHLEILEAFAASQTQEGGEKLWVGESGEAAVKLFRDLQEESGLISLKPFEYFELIKTLMASSQVRPKYGTHPRLLIMGQIEARLMKADVMILSGMNEGIWPTLPDADPWMSRPMRTDFGLPDNERSIALSAHDFVQAFSSKDIVLTRCLRQDGVTSVPSRWLQRLDTVLQACNIPPQVIRQGSLKNWAQQIDEFEGKARASERPSPTPSVERRPKSLPVTAIENWMRDPYSLYAKYILDLRPLPDIEQNADAALRGTWLHDVFEWFVRNYPREIPQSAAELMYEYALESPELPETYELFVPRLKRIFDWFVAQEKSWRETASVSPERLELRGRIEFDGFSLSAKADRIDYLKNTQSAAIIDYKTGRIPNASDILNGLSPQMTLEGAILQEGGFKDIDRREIDSLRFWKVSGGLAAGEDKLVEGRNFPEIDQLIDDALAGLKKLVAEFDQDNTPYISLPDVSIAPPDEWQDYAQLARVQEWATIEESEGS